MSRSRPATIQDDITPREDSSRMKPGSSPSGERKGSLTPRWVPYLVASPALLLLVGVVCYPLVQSLLYGLQERSLLGGGTKFVGFGKLSNLAADPSFWRVLWQTIVFVGASSVGAFLLALALALALDTKLIGRGFWRTGFLFPWLMPPAVVSFLWAWIFDAHYGILNGLIYFVTGAQESGINWLDTSGFAMMAIVIARVWNTFGWMMILILAALQGLPAETHEAAAVDGARGIKKQVYVVLPQIRPALILALLLEVIHGFQQFDIPWVMTSGGPVGSTTTLSVDLYKTAFVNFDLGSAGAIGIAWTILMALLVGIFMFYTSRQERAVK